VVSRQNADIAGTLHLRDVVMATIFGFPMWCTSVPPGEFDSTDRVWRQCGLMSDYLDHLLLCCNDVTNLHHFGTY